MREPARRADMTEMERRSERALRFLAEAPRSHAEIAEHLGIRTGSSVTGAVQRLQRTFGRRIHAGHVRRNGRPVKVFCADRGRLVAEQRASGLDVDGLVLALRRPRTTGEIGEMLGVDEAEVRFMIRRVRTWKGATVFMRRLPGIGAIYGLDEEAVWDRFTDMRRVGNPKRDFPKTEISAIAA
jgi:hypothetical protein